MHKPPALLGASFILVLVFSNSFALADMTFRLVSKSSGKCITLQAADQNDGGGLTLRPCENLPDFFVSGTFSLTSLQFKLNRSRSVCIFATDTPVIDPTGQRAKVRTRNCGNLAASMWNIRGADNDGFRQVEKMNGIDHTNFCMRQNNETSEVELEVCQSIPQQMWKAERIIFPDEQ